MKRLLAFLALLALGIVALRLAIGDENAIAGRGDRPRTPSTPPGSGITVQQGNLNAEVTQRGDFLLSRWREVQETATRTRRELVYELRAADSQPLGSGRQQLDGLEMRLFDDGQRVGTLTAKQAFVTVRADANGVPSLDEGKDIDLRDAVFATTPSSKLQSMRLELATALIKVEEDEILLTAPIEVPVFAVLDGTPQVTLRGFGTQARLPRNDDSALRRADVEILRQPTLSTAGLELRAAGRLRFVQDIDTGAGLVTLDERVECDFTSGELAPTGARGAGAIKVRGDQFFGWLQRRDDQAKDATGGDDQERAADWRQLLLVGAPATVELPWGKLSTPRVTALPGVLGDPFSITAHGGAARLEQTALRDGARFQELLTGTSERPIHYVLPREQGGALHRSFGFPRWAMRPLEDLQVVVLEGAAELTGETLQCRARDGLRILRRDGSDAGTLVGLGPAHVTKRATKPDQADFAADVSDGFTLAATTTGERLQLGPPAPADPDAKGRWRDHTFAVRYGDATMRGRGVGEFSSSGKQSRLSFLSPDAGMVAKMPGQGLDLARLRSLEATFDDREPLALDIAGWPIDMHWTRGGDSLAAKAPRVLQTGPHSLRLLPADASRPGLWSGLPAAAAQPSVRRGTAAHDRHGAQQLEVRGPHIDVHHAGGRDLIVDAVAVDDELPHVYAQIDQAGGGEPTTIACAAERLRVLPFVLTPLARGWLVGGDDDPLARIATFGVAQPWLSVEDVREFALDDPRHGHVEGNARRLYVSHGGRAALFVGDATDGTPARVTRTAKGRAITLLGSRVRLFDDDKVRLQALGTFVEGGEFTPPSMTLRESEGRGLLSHMRAVCRGDIEVVPEAVLFGGRVLAHGLRRDGEIDPSGLRIDARELSLLRDADATSERDGDVVRAIGRDVTFAWSHVRAVCAQMDLDVIARRLVATDDDEAVVTLPGGREVRAPRVELDYERMALRTSSTRVVQRAGGEGRK
jgi:hypothetical protein